MARSALKYRFCYPKTVAIDDGFFFGDPANDFAEKEVAFMPLCMWLQFLPLIV